MKILFACAIGIFLCMLGVALAAARNYHASLAWKEKAIHQVRLNQSLEAQIWADSIRHQLKQK